MNVGFDKAGKDLEALIADVKPRIDAILDMANTVACTTNVILSNVNSIVVAIKNELHVLLPKVS